MRLSENHAGTERNAMPNPLVQKVVRLVRRASVRFLSPVVARLRGVNEGVVRREILYAMLEIEGPDPEVWAGPIFIHVPKAAGSSILATGVKSTPGHKPLSFYLRHRPKGVKMPVTFAVVRHPVDRYVSAFYFLRGGGINPHDALWAARHIPPEMDHNAFAERLVERPDYLRQLHLQPQTPMLTDGAGAIAVDRVLRIETLRADWPAFAEAHGLTPDLPEKNTGAAHPGGGPPPTTERCIEILRRVYAEDFTRLGYAGESGAKTL